MEASTSARTELLCCRACLATDCKLFDIHKYDLAAPFARVTGAPVLIDGSPQHLCSICSAQLVRCEAFREKCLRSFYCLRARERQGELDTDSIRTIDRARYNLLHNLTFTTTQAIDHLIKTPEGQEIKDEPDIDDTKDEIKTDDAIKDDLKTEEKEVEMSFDRVEEVFVIDVEDIKKKKRGSAAKKKMEVNKNNQDDDIDFDDIFNDDSDTDCTDNDDNYEVEVVKKKPVKKDQKKKTVVRRKKVKTDESKDVDEKPKAKRKPKKDSKRKFRNAENDYMPVFDFAKFESTYAVRVVTLSKEDQLEEIATRKESANYLESPFQCEDCGKGFLSDEPYNNHRLRHSPSAGQYACEICKVRFTMQCRRQEHQDAHRLKFFCRDCSFVSRNRHQAKRHYDMHAGKTYECKHCGKMFNRSSTYLSHVRLSHPAENVACDMCGETFVGQVGLRQHKSKMHAEHLKPEKFQCETCSATFLSVEALNHHTDTAGDHVDLRSCEQCGENCASEAALEAHVSETHRTDKYRCEECCATFTHSAAYELHHRRKHLGQRFSAAGRRIARPNNGHYVCEQCGRVLTSRQGLRYHQRDHKGMNEKPFECSECKKKFAAKHMRDWHMRSHTGEKPYQCPDCPLAFSLNSNFKRHHKAVHLGLRASFPCSICGRVFTTSSCVRVHVNMVHRGMPWPKRSRRGKEPKPRNK